MVQCPSKCGDLSELEKPMLVLIGMDVECELDEELPEHIPRFVLIPQICLKCGYYTQVQFFTQDDFERYSQHRISLECKETGQIFIIRKAERPKAEVG